MAPAGEPSPTLRAFKGLFSGVGGLVAVEVRVGGETSPALWTLIGLFSGVGQLVVS